MRLEREKLRFDEGGVYTWLTVQPLANKYACIERNDNLPTSSRDVYFAKTASISYCRAYLANNFLVVRVYELL